MHYKSMHCNSVEGKRIRDRPLEPCGRWSDRMMETRETCAKNCAMRSSWAEHEATGSWGEGQDDNTRRGQHCVLLWLMGSLPQFTLHYLEAKPMNILGMNPCTLLITMRPPRCVWGEMYHFQSYSASWKRVPVQRQHSIHHHALKGLFSLCLNSS